jgi:glycosyltransferase involved in cell wall biosynthesis
LSKIPAADAAIATLWTTAYFLLRFNNTRRKFYFIQDCESLFYPAGSIAAQAEATYRFGFFGIANTRTLKEMYEQRYGGIAEFFEPAIDLDVFHSNRTPPLRKKKRIFFYGRPDHPRNAFELGLASLIKTKERLGEQIEIVAAGAAWKPRRFGVDGIVENLGLLSYEKTAELYRTCDIGVLLMLTRHPSYIPLELMSSGCVVVSNWNPDTTWLMQHDMNCVLVRPAASCIADAIADLVKDSARRHRLRNCAARIVTERFSSWDEQIDKAFAFICQPTRRDGSSELANRSRLDTR